MRRHAFIFLLCSLLLPLPVAAVEPVVINAPDGVRTFGSAAAIENDVLVVGAARADVNDNQYQGAAFVFERVEDEWVQRARLLAPGGGAEDFFGTQVAMQGDTIAVSAPRESVSGLERAGAVHVFRRIEQEWRHVARVTAEDPQAFDRFGQQLAMDGGTIMISKLREASATVLPEGAVYFFAHDRERAQWRQVTKCLPPAEHGPVFGNSIAMENDRAVAGVMNDGVVMMYARDGSVWREHARLNLPRSEGDPLPMITQVALHGGNVIAGAPMQAAEEDDGANGRVFILETVQRTGETVTLHDVVELASPDPESVQFGWTLQLHDDVLAVMPQYDDTAWLYQRTAAGWQSYATLSAPDLVESDAAVLALSAEHLVMRGDNTVLLFALPKGETVENNAVGESGDEAAGGNTETGASATPSAMAGPEGGGGAAGTLVALLVGSCAWRKVQA